MMTPSEHIERVAVATAEEVLRVIYGDDLQGCAVNLDDVAAVIRTGLEEHSRAARDISDLHTKAFEAVELLATPPGDGQALSPEDLRSLLGDRLDKIKDLSAKVLAATNDALAIEGAQDGPNAQQA